MSRVNALNPPTVSVCVKYILTKMDDLAGFTSLLQHSFFFFFLMQIFLWPSLLMSSDCGGHWRGLSNASAIFFRTF